MGQIIFHFKAIATSLTQNAFTRLVLPSPERTLVRRFYESSSVERFSHALWNKAIDLEFCDGEVGARLSILCFNGFGPA